MTSLSQKQVRALCLFTIIPITLLFSLSAMAEDISLPAPHTEGGKPLMQAIRERRSIRTYSSKKLPPQVLSDLLWAAAGINRPEAGKRTVASAKNQQEVEVYAITEEGAYLYDAKANRLKMVAKGDLRKLAGTQDYVATAPLNLIYVADTTKMVKDASPDDQLIFAGASTGFMSQNVYLFSASEGLATVIRAGIDRKALGKPLKLPDTKRILLEQCVGYPAGAHSSTQ